MSKQDFLGVPALPSGFTLQATAIPNALADELHRLEYLESVEFPTPSEFDELRRLLVRHTNRGPLA